MTAFQLGLDQGADAIECDVHVSSDGELVVIHDADIQRIAGIDRAVMEMALADILALDAGVPSLAEVLDLIPADRRILIEVKCGMTALPPLEKLLSETELSMSQIVLMEFDLETVIEMKKIFPAVEVLWLNDFHPLHFPWQKKRALEQILKTTLQHGLDGVNLRNISQLTARFIGSCHEQGLKCYCWTVDDDERAAKLIKNGIDGITTNRPGWMRGQLNLANPRTW